MKMFKRFIFVMLMACSFSSLADYYECNISNGAVGYCGSWAQAKGYPVQDQSGTFHDCDINNGSVGFCSGWSQRQGFPVKQADGSYSKCDIDNGSVGFCAGWYQGKAYIQK